MSDNTFDSAIKTRVPLAQKERLDRIAKEKHLKTADVVREAIRRYLRHTRDTTKRRARSTAAA